MHIRCVEIENVRSIKHLVWELPDEIWNRTEKSSKPKEGAGWHVILGDNGSGKTSFVRAVASLCIETGLFFLTPFLFGDLTRSGQSIAIGTIKILAHPEFDACRRQPGNYVENRLSSSYEMIETTDDNDKEIAFVASDNGPWITSTEGWFIASFGPIRQISGKKISDNYFFDTHQEIARHANIATEPYGLGNFVDWLQKTEFSKLEGDADAEKLSKSIRDFINQTGFLAHNAQLIAVTSKDILIEDAEGNRVAINEMSDGYRSVLSLTLELIRHLVLCFGVDRVFDPNDATKIIAPGVVQIDEVDAHLHPSWQRRIGQWFTEHFPNIQFIVTTHSPLICQAADSVFVLPTPGTDELGGFVSERDLLRLKNGDVLDAYSTGVFGEGVERSEKSKELLRELAELNTIELERDLTKSEQERRDSLRGMMPSSAYSMNGQK
jgi:energy-coupling factor transporter ATP-binding protein EcfA2